MTNVSLYTVMKYLKDNHYEESWLALQKQSQVKLHSYPKQIQFLRRIILKGDFEQVIQFISTLQAHLDSKIYKRSCLTIYKQKLYELINQPNQIELKNLFEKQIVSCCDEEEFQYLFTLLTCRKTQEIQGLGEWTVIKGRLRVFEELLVVVEGVLGGKKLDDVNANANNSYLNKMALEINLDEIIALHLNKTNHKIEEKVTLSTVKINKNLSQIISNSQIKKSTNNLTSKVLDESRKQVELELSQSRYGKSNVNFDKKSQIHRNFSHIKQPMHSSQLNRASQKQSNTIPSRSRADYNIINSNQYRAEDHHHQINQISEQQQRSQTIGENQFEDSHEKNSEDRQRQNKNNNSEYSHNNDNDNLEYLQQTNSVVYNTNNEGENNDRSGGYHENFTFSQHNLQNEITRPRQIVKLTAISDIKAIRTCQFSRSGNFFALGTNSSLLKVFYVEQLFQENKFQPHLQPIYQINSLHSKSIFCLDWASNQTSMVTCSNDLTIKVTQFDTQFTSHEVSVIGRHQSCIRMVKFNQNHNKIFSCGDDSLVKIWDMGKVKRCYNLKGHKAGINAFKLTQNQQELYTVSKDSTIKRWDLRSLDCVATSKPQQSEITFIANNTDRIVASNRNGNVLFFDDNLNFEYEVKVHQQQIRSIECSKSKDLFLAASFDGHVSMFSQKTCHSPDYFQHNQNSEDKVVFATFLDHPEHRGFASTSTLGFCHIYSYF